MSRDILKSYGGMLLTLIAMVVAAGFFVARAVADQRVQPVEARVGVLETDQRRQDEITKRVETKLDNLDSKLDVLLRRTGR